MMFGASEDAVSEEEVQDALGEVANMTGGSVKNTLTGRSELSLPAVTEGTDYTVTVPGSKLVSQVNFECEGEPLEVSILEKE